MADTRPRTAAELWRKYAPTALRDLVTPDPQEGTVYIDVPGFMQNPPQPPDDGTVRFAAPSWYQDAPALFYDKLQKRDKSGKWQDEGKGAAHKAEVEANKAEDEAAAAAKAAAEAAAKQKAAQKAAQAKAAADAAKGKAKAKNAKQEAAQKLSEGVQSGKGTIQVTGMPQAVPAKPALGTGVHGLHDLLNAAKQGELEAHAKLWTKTQNGTLVLHSDQYLELVNAATTSDSAPVKKMALMWKSKYVDALEKEGHGPAPAAPAEPKKLEKKEAIKLALDASEGDVDAHQKLAAAYELGQWTPGAEMLEELVSGAEMIQDTDKGEYYIDKWVNATDKKVADNEKKAKAKKKTAPVLGVSNDSAPVKDMIVNATHGNASAAKKLMTQVEVGNVTLTPKQLQGINYGLSKVKQEDTELSMDAFNEMKDFFVEAEQEALLADLNEVAPKPTSETEKPQEDTKKQSVANMVDSAVSGNLHAAQKLYEMQSKGSIALGEMDLSDIKEALGSIPYKEAEKQGFDSTTHSNLYDYFLNQYLNVKHAAQQLPEKKGNQSQAMANLDQQKLAAMAQVGAVPAAHELMDRIVAGTASVTPDEAKVIAKKLSQVSDKDLTLYGYTPEQRDTIKSYFTDLAEAVENGTYMPKKEPEPSTLIPAKSKAVTTDVDPLLKQQFDDALALGDMKAAKSIVEELQKGNIALSAGEAKALSMSLDTYSYESAENQGVGQIDMDIMRGFMKDYAYAAQSAAEIPPAGTDDYEAQGADLAMKNAIPKAKTGNLNATAEIYKQLMNGDVKITDEDAAEIHKALNDIAYSYHEQGYTWSDYNAFVGFFNPLDGMYNNKGQKVSTMPAPGSDLSEVALSSGLDFQIAQAKKGDPAYHNYLSDMAAKDPNALTVQQLGDLMQSLPNIDTYLSKYEYGEATDKFLAGYKKAMGDGPKLGKKSIKEWQAQLTYQKEQMDAYTPDSYNYKLFQQNVADTEGYVRLLAAGYDDTTTDIGSIPQELLPTVPQTAADLKNYIEKTKDVVAYENPELLTTKIKKYQLDQAKVAYKQAVDAEAASPDAVKVNGMTVAQHQLAIDEINDQKAALSAGGNYDYNKFLELDALQQTHWSARGQAKTLEADKAFKETLKKKLPNNKTLGDYYQAQQDALKAAKDQYEAWVTNKDPDQAQAMQDQYTKLSEQGNAATVTFEVAQNPNPASEYDSIIAKLKSYYEGVKNEDNDYYIKQYEVKKAAYEAVHDLKPPADMPTTYVNPHGYTEGEQMGFEQFTDTEGNVLDPGRYDPDGHSFQELRANSDDEEKLEEYYTDWASRLDGDQRDALQFYQGSGYAGLNQYLRFGDSSGEEPDIDMILEDFDEESSMQSYTENQMESDEADFQAQNDYPEYSSFTDEETGEVDEDAYDAAVQEWTDQYQYDLDEYLSEKQGEWVQADKESYIENYESNNGGSYGSDEGGYDSITARLDRAYEDPGAVAPHNMITWRKGHMNDPESGDVENDLEVDQLVTDHGFVSTSISKDTVMSFSGELFRIEVPKGLKAIYLDVQHDISEHEVLLPRDSYYVVTRVDEVPTDYGSPRKQYTIRYLGPDYDPDRDPLPGKGSTSNETETSIENPGGVDSEGDVSDEIKATTWYQEMLKSLADEQAEKERKYKQHPELLKAAFRKVDIQITRGGGNGQRLGTKTQDDKWTWRPEHFVSTGRKLGIYGPGNRPQQMPQAQPWGTLTGDQTWLGSGQPKFTTDPVARLSVAYPQALFYSPAQARDRTGKWVETGAEQRRKQRVKSDALLDDTITFTHADPKSAEDTLDGGYEGFYQKLDDSMERAANDYKLQFHAMINQQLRTGFDWDKARTPEEWGVLYDDTELAKDEAWWERTGARKYTLDMKAEIMADKRLIWTRAMQIKWQDAQDTMHDTIANTVRHLDRMFTLPEARAPFNVRVFRRGFLPPAGLEQGRAYMDKGFVSTTTAAVIAERFGGEPMVVEVPEDMPAAYLGDTGFDLNSERELLLPRNSVFVYMGETGEYGPIRGGYAKVHRFRYIGQKEDWQGATFANDPDTDTEQQDPDQEDRFTWQEGDLVDTGLLFTIPSPAQLPPQKPAGSEGRAEFFRPDQRRGFHGQWVDEGRSQVATQTREAEQRPQLDANVVMHKKTGSAAGSNLGGFYEGADGVERYVKQYGDETQAHSEVVANEIYRKMGVAVPNATTMYQNSQLLYASDIIPGADISSQVGNSGLTQERARNILDGFVVDVLTANRDVLGLGFDNVIDVNGTIWRVDNGSAFLHRAQGARKDTYGLDDIGEWESLAPGGRNANYAKVWRTAGYDGPEDPAYRSQIDSQIAALRKLYDSLEDSGGWDGFIEQHAPAMDRADREAIVDMLESRTRKLLKKHSKATFSKLSGFYDRWLKGAK